MKKVILACCYLFINAISIGQNFQWVKNSSIETKKIVTDGDGNLYACSSNSIIKYDSNGNILWQQNITGASYDIIVAGIVCDKYNNVYMSGAFGHTISIGSYSITSDAGGNSNTFLVKYNSAGVIQWVTRTHSNADGGADDIAIDNQDNVLLIGRFLDSMRIDSYVFDAPSTNQIFLAKYSASGLCLWAKHITSASFSGGMIGPKVKCDKTGNVYITGHFINYALFDSLQVNAHGGAADEDVFLAKLTQNGIPQWAKAIGGVYPETTGPMDVDSLGNIYLSGDYSSPTTYFDSYTLSSTASSPERFTAMYSALGNCLWVKNANALTLCAAGDGFYANTPSLLSKYDISGVVVWNKFVADASNKTIAINGNNIFIAGNFINSPSFDSYTLNNTSNSYIAKVELNTTAVEETNISFNVSIFPNPSSYLVNISLKLVSIKNPITICIKDFLGKYVYYENVNDCDEQLTKQLNLSYLSKGIYFIEISHGQKRIVKKIVLQ
jgi:hypothetical protein